MFIGNKEFNTENNVYIMGILNCTPDSFSDGGEFNDIDKALFHTEKMIKDGASIIDVGGESTRPGYTKISEAEEIQRIVPIIEKINANFDTVISVDTYKSVVATEAIKAGADLVNDIWGCKYDKQMAEIIAKNNVACCLMHNRDIESNPYKTSMNKLNKNNTNISEVNPEKYDIIDEVLSDLKGSIEIAINAGISKDKIILDPGIGFAKNYEQNLSVMKNLERIKELGYPVLLGTSRKSMIGLALNLPKEERLEGTIATSVMGVVKGCSFIRVHDVLENKRAVDMTKLIK